MEINFIQTRENRWEARVGLECVGIVSQVNDPGPLCNGFTFHVAMINDDGEALADIFWSLEHAQKFIVDNA